MWGDRTRKSCTAINVVMESKKEKGENRIFVHVNMRRLGVQDGCSQSSDCIYPIHVMLLLRSVAAQEKLRADE